MTDTVETETIGYEPYFIDGDGKEVHIGDMVLWTSSANTSAACTKSGRVLEIIYKTIDGVTDCMVKVKGRQPFIAPKSLLLIENETLKGKLRYLVATSGGCIDSEQIDATAAEIEEMFVNEADADADET